MRSVLISITALLCLCLATFAQAEQRMFIIANDADGYGIDRCLASGAKCGAPAATAYCKTQAFAEAATYHKVERAEVSGAIPATAAGGCPDSSCNIVAIVCTR